MKKQYSKPDILFEDFSLSTSIAGTCENTDINSTQYACAYGFGFDMVFLEAVQACVKKISEGSINDGLCYHIHTDSNNLFNS